MQSKTGPHLSIHSFWFNGPMRNKRRKSHSSSGSNYRPDPGENGQDSLVLAGSCIWVIQVMQALRTSAGGLLMEGSHFIAALVVQSGHSTHALSHQIRGTRTEGQGVAVKSGEQRSHLGLSESFSFSKLAAGAAQSSSALPASFPMEKLLLAPSHAAWVQWALSCQFCKGS